MRSEFGLTRRILLITFLCIALGRPCLTQTCASGECEAGGSDEDDGSGLEEEEFLPRVIIHSPESGSVVHGYVTIAWEVLFFDIAEGFVIVEVDGEAVETPLPLDPLSQQGIEAELFLDSRFGSGVPLEEGLHAAAAVLYKLNGQRVAAAAVNFSVAHSPRGRGPNYTAVGNAQSMHTMLEASVRSNRAVDRVFAEWITEWPIAGRCGLMQPVPGFPEPEEYGSRPLLVYACPPDVCGGTLSWLHWQEEAVSRCGAGCLWLERMACPHAADVLLLSCFADPPPGFAKWPHQVWAYFCMESDTRRNMLSPRILPLIDVFANYRLHPDMPRELQPGQAQHAAATPRDPVHVTVTYTPGNPDMYLLGGSGMEGGGGAEKPYLAAYLVSNCGRPRDLYVSRLLNALGPDLLHSYGRCFNNRAFPQDKAHGSNTLALLGKYKFTIAIENYLSHDYVSERFYQPLIAGSVPVYLGAPNIQEFAPGENAYVSIRDFASPEDLAAHLQRLAAEPAAYNQLLAWRREGLAPSFQRLMEQSMTRGAVYGEGKHHGCQHKVDLTRLHQAMCRKVQQVPSRSEVVCDSEGT